MLLIVWGDKEGWCSKSSRNFKLKTRHPLLRTLYLPACLWELLRLLMCSQALWSGLPALPLPSPPEGLHMFLPSRHTAAHCPPAWLPSSALPTCAHSKLSHALSAVLKHPSPTPSNSPRQEPFSPEGTWTLKCHFIPLLNQENEGFENGCFLIHTFNLFQAISSFQISVCGSIPPSPS